MRTPAKGAKRWKTYRFFSSTPSKVVGGSLRPVMLCDTLPATIIVPARACAEGAEAAAEEEEDELLLLLLLLELELAAAAAAATAGVASLPPAAGAEAIDSGAAALIAGWKRESDTRARAQTGRHCQAAS